MGKIDVVQMDFLRNPRHFADIWNGLVFNGKQVVKPDELAEISPVGLANSGEMNLKKTADMAMCRTVDGKILAVMITENQKEIDYSLPVRVRLREFMEYDKQVAEISRKNRENQKGGEKVFSDAGEYMYGFTKEDRLKPVMTLVLSWNDKEWAGVLSLYDMLDFSGFEELKGLVSDYKMNVVNMDSITDEENRFSNSEVRDVVSLYLRRNDKIRFKKYVDEHGEGINRDCMNMLNTFVGSKELKNYMDDNCGEKGVERNMCKAITELIEDGRRDGIKDGRKEGRKEGQEEYRELVNKLNSKLCDDGRMDDLKRTFTDRAYQDSLIKELFPDEWEILNNT